MFKTFILHYLQRVSLQLLQQSPTSTLGPSAEDKYVQMGILLNRHLAAEVNTPYEPYKLNSKR
jgi:hypothetical protein